MLDRGIEFLQQTAPTHMGRVVTYHRGAAAVAVLAIPSTPDQTLMAVETTNPQYDVREWLIRADALTSFGPPRAGDYITTGPETYRIYVEHAGRPAWELRDAMYRIRTVRA